jgi:phosphoglycerate dehydrogenase-like enzyme
MKLNRRNFVRWCGWPALLVCLFPLNILADALADEKELLRAAAVQILIQELGIRESGTAARDMEGWVRPKKVLLRLDNEERLAGFQAVAPGVEVVLVSSTEEAVAASDGAQVLIGFCSEEILAAAPEIHWVQVYSSGVDHCVVNPGMKTGNKVLTNGQRISSPALAEHAIALMMALARGLDVFHSNQMNQSWDRDVDLGSGEFMEMAGRTVLVVGLGGIGTQVAKRAHGLGMRVIATRGSRREGPDYVEYVGLADELLELAGQADVVINTAPLTDRTRGIFNAEFFTAMKPTAYFVSVGRGASTDTNGLINALNQGEIAGAGLDVTDPEPLPADHPLWKVRRVIISPHTAGRSDKGRDRLYLLVQENLRRYVAGEPLLSVVNIDRGY